MALKLPNFPNLLTVTFATEVEFFSVPPPPTVVLLPAFALLSPFVLTKVGSSQSSQTFFDLLSFENPGSFPDAAYHSFVFRPLFSPLPNFFAFLTLLFLDDEVADLNTLLLGEDFAPSFPRGDVEGFLTLTFFSFIKSREEFSLPNSNEAEITAAMVLSTDDEVDADVEGTTGGASSIFTSGCGGSAAGGGSASIGTGTRVANVAISVTGGVDLACKLIN